MRGILINPNDRTIAQIEVGPRLAGLYAAMKQGDGEAFSGTIELVRLSPSVDLWIDEEGNLSAGRPVWHLIDAHGEPVPFAGAALLLGNDGEGGSASLPAQITTAIMSKLAHWTDLVTTGDCEPMTTEDGPDGFVIRTGKAIHEHKDGPDA